MLSIRDVTNTEKKYFKYEVKITEIIFSNTANKYFSFKTFQISLLSTLFVSNKITVWVFELLDKLIKILYGYLRRTQMVI